MTADDIRRIINNQKSEHVPHAFRAGGVGMAEFNSLYPVFRKLPTDQLAKWMRVIDRMRLTHGLCESCVSKILGYSILFTDERLPKLHERYVALYHSLTVNSTSDRDYMKEVWDSLSGGPDSPYAENHKRFWRAVAQETPPNPR